MKNFPASLRASTPAEGYALARQMAESALAASDILRRDMATHLSAPPPPPIELTTAFYFQSVAVANEGWTR